MINNKYEIIPVLKRNGVYGTVNVGVKSTYLSIGLKSPSQQKMTTCQLAIRAKSSAMLIQNICNRAGSFCQKEISVILAIAVMIFATNCDTEINRADCILCTVLTINCLCRISLCNRNCPCGHNNFHHNIFPPCL